MNISIYEKLKGGKPCSSQKGVVLGATRAQQKIQADAPKGDKKIPDRPRRLSGTGF